MTRKPKTFPTLSAALLSPKITKSELLDSLERLRRQVCQYAGDRCDCKFGGPLSGERTGCPELATVSDLVRNLSAKEFSDILKRKKPHGCQGRRG